MAKSIKKGGKKNYQKVWSSLMVRHSAPPFRIRQGKLKAKNRFTFYFKLYKLLTKFGGFRKVIKKVLNYDLSDYNDKYDC